MKINFTYCARGILCFFIFCSLARRSEAQVCSDPAHVIYGLTQLGNIRPLHVNNAMLDSPLNSTVGLPVTPYSNAMGYNPVNGNFYYFAVEQQSPIRFVSFNPSTGVTTDLTTLPNYSNVVSGCVNAAGTRFYCLNAGSQLSYYNIATDSWSMLTTDFVDQYGQDVTNNFLSLEGGDMAMDGSGNIWMIISSSNTYALYVISATSIPADSVGSIPVIQVIPPTSSSFTGGKSFDGIAFDPIGQIYLSTQTDLYLLESNWSTIDHIGSFNLSSSEDMYDLTSCNFPQTVLAVSWMSFTASFQSDRSVLLAWQYGKPVNQGVFSIQRSADGRNWSQIDTLQVTNASSSSTYSYSDAAPLTGKNYYRIRLQAPNAPDDYSTIKLIERSENAMFVLFPNPVENTLNIQYNGKEPIVMIRLYDLTGAILMVDSALSPGFNAISVSNLTSGVYIAVITLGNGQVYAQKMFKQ